MNLLKHFFSFFYKVELEKSALKNPQFFAHYLVKERLTTLFVLMLYGFCLPLGERSQKQ
jgi:hypothetical protein